MITTITDDDNKVISWVEWRQVGPSGFDVLRGEYIWVNDLWVHPEYRNKGLIKELIQQVAWKVPEAKFMYFSRRKYNSRLRIYKRHQLEKSIKGVVQLEKD